MHFLLLVWHMDPTLATILVLASVPTFVIARSVVKGRCVPIVFAAFYPAMLIWAAAFVCTVWALLACVRLIEVE